MLKEITWPNHRRFKSRTEWEPVGFFSECLCNSTRFDLMLGFFSSSAISVLADGFASFLYNGGQMRLIINDVLTEQDRDAIASGKSAENIPFFDLSNIEKIKDTLSERDTHFFECLSWLIKNNRLEIKIIAPKNSIGISHTKSGVFNDGLNTISFDGSCNFSRTALVDNIESLTVSCDWDGDIEIAKIDSIKDDFESVFQEKDENVIYVDASNVKTQISNSFKDKSINDLLENEYTFLDNDIIGKTFPKTVINALEKAKKRVETAIEKIKSQKEKENNNKTVPTFPYPTGPRKYQQIAFENWKNNKKQGLFAMATGTGKTITSLNCLLQEYLESGYYNALILVPTMSLVDQWEEECKKFNFKENIIKVYSACNWLGQLEKFDTFKSLNEQFSFIIIATYKSFLTKKFQDKFKQLPQETLLIADEAHTIGAPSILNKLKHIHLLKRIGLSATPERQYQDEINNKIKAFFGENLDDDYTFTYTMEDAIKKEPRALCPYRYYPRIVKLTDSEFEGYVDYTRRIVAMHPKNDDEREIFNRLCIARQRIIHKAENKLDAFKSIIHEEYKKRGNLKYTLIYVPEGLADEDVIFDATKKDILSETDADRNLLNLYTRTINEEIGGISVRQFIGCTSAEDRKDILKNFAVGNLQVITSMKCLDEGIDIPRSELAIFCSSTGNPRQFIQRRGRVLRLSDGKDEATIYDLIVIPDISGDDSLFNTERNEIEKELRRVRDFAEMSENKHYTRQILYDILTYYNLNL